MGNRKNATKKRNLSKIKNKTSDGDKTQTEIVDYDEKRDSVQTEIVDYDEKRDSVDVVDAEKSCDKSSGQMNSGEKSVVEVKNSEKQVEVFDKTIATSTSPVKNTKTEIIYGDEEKGGEQTLTQIKNNTLINTEYTQNTTNFGITSCPKCPDEIPGGRMIMCDECHEWFHFICLGIDERVEVEDFNCNKCLEELHTKMIQMLTPIPKMGDEKVIVENPGGRDENIVIQSTPKKGGGGHSQKNNKIKNKDK